MNKKNSRSVKYKIQETKTSFVFESKLFCFNMPIHTLFFLLNVWKG